MVLVISSKPVGKRTLAVINMGYNTEISYVIHLEGPVHFSCKYKEFDP